MEALETQGKDFWGTIVRIGTGIGRGIKYLLSWQWTKKVAYWMVFSAGTMSELAFLAASLWISINANVHTFVRIWLSEVDTVHLTDLSTTAYVALPECIAFLAVFTTLSHVRTWMENKQDIKPLIWSIFFGLPTIIFVVLSVYTLSNAVANHDFKMDITWQQVRAIAAYAYAFTSFLYVLMGEKQEADRLKEKDVIISDLKLGLDAKVSELTEKLESKTAELNAIISQQKAELEKSKRDYSAMQNAVIKSSEDGLEAYSQDCKNWLYSGSKTANVDEINQFTGHSKRKLNAAIDAGKLTVSTRNKSLITKTSLVEWLKNNQPNSEKLVMIKGHRSEMNTEELNAI